MERTGSELIQASRAFAEEDPRRTWRELALTFVAAAAFFAIAAAPMLGPARWLGTLGLSLITVRFFIFFHDALHGAIFRKNKLGHFIMDLVGWTVLTPRPVWRDSHNYHHAHTSKMVGSSIGSFPLLSIEMYRAATPSQRFMYRASRHWLTMAFGYFTVFLWGMCIKPFIMRPRRYWTAPLALAFHYGCFAAIAYLGGFGLALRTHFVPVFVACALGSYMFYAQHTFPGMRLWDRKDWEYTAAALHSSSMMTMSAPMHWFTGNIGFHHVHHLNSMIPFYRLDEAMNAIPELQSPRTTSWSPKEIWTCLRLHLWDGRAERMLTFREATEVPAQTTASEGA
ncbi:MAG: fatty acid desaturase [Deltaproteobacteria bacterium]|nr:fatty acid desaturase [Deltaproteobacteria bacterium]